MEQQPTSPEAAPQKERSAFSLLLNVYAAPGEVFDQIKAAPTRNALWAIPVALAIIVGILSIFVVFSDPMIESQLRDRMEQQIEEQIAREQIPPEEADALREQMASFAGGTMFKIGGSLGVIVLTFASILVVSAVMLLVGKLGFKASAPYGKVMEVVGASMMINHVLGTAITMLLILATGSLYATPGLGLLIGEFDPENEVHVLASAVNVFSLWYLAVLSIGLGKLFDVTTGKAAVWVVGLWVVWTLLTTFVLTFLRF